MIKRTRDYELFKFRSDNRERIVHAHVQKLVESIRSRNMLELRPIIVNGEMEIIDGQHRFLAAKQLNVDIFYQIESKLSSKEIILMNISKSWTMGDYLNFYSQNEYPEYKKLQQFIKLNNLSLKVAIRITMGTKHEGFTAFKNGEYVYIDDVINEHLDFCWETIDFIKKMNGFSPYTSSARFWNALLKLVRVHDFDKQKWKYNLQRMIERFCCKAKTQDYLRLFMDVYNYRNEHKINLLEEVY